jgi:hypothetical protein
VRKVNERRVLSGMAGTSGGTLSGLLPRASGSGISQYNDGWGSKATIPRLKDALHVIPHSGKQPRTSELPVDPYFIDPASRRIRRNHTRTICRILTRLTKRVSSVVPRRCYSIEGGRSRGTRFSRQLIHTFGTTGPRRRYGRLVCGTQKQLQVGSTKRRHALRVSVGWISLTPGGPGFLVWTGRSGPP